MKKSSGKTMLVNLGAGLLGGILVLGGFLFFELQPKTLEELLSNYYDMEVAARVSPQRLRRYIDRVGRNITLVDLRSQTEYEEGHIIGAINIPVYTIPLSTDYNAMERIVAAFSALDQTTEIIIYCDSAPCSSGAKVGQLLADHDIYVSYLSIGWEEWKNDWDKWNQDIGEQLDRENYYFTGSDPGMFEGEVSAGCPVGADFSC